MNVQSENQNRFDDAKPAGLYLMELRSRVAEKDARRNKLAASILLSEQVLPVAASGSERARRVRN